MNIEILNIKESDLLIVYDINVASNLTYWTLNQFYSEFNQASDFHFKIILNDKIIGFIFSIFILGDLNINNICIIPEHQHKGLGSLILNYTLERASQNDSNYAYLEVRSNNLKAIKLYEKFGFITNNIRKKYYSNNEDAVLMSLDFSLLHK